MDVCLADFIYWSCCSNLFVDRVGVYMLTEPHGLNYITSCEQEGFHTHPKEPPLYEVSSHAHMYAHLIMTLCVYASMYVFLTPIHNVHESEGVHTLVIIVVILTCTDYCILSTYI